MRQPTRTLQESQRLPSALAAKTIEPIQVQSTATVIYTATDREDFWVKHLAAANVSGGASAYTLHVVPSGGSVGASNMILDAKVIATNTTDVIESLVNHRIPVGASIQALCTTNNDVNIFGWGYDQTGEL
jgi:hypothetical protein